MHRRLITKEVFADWAEELGFIRSFGFERDDFFIFFDYLEEIELMSPLKVAKKGSEFGSQMTLEKGTLIFEKHTDEYLNTIDYYYHPFQFFQFILYYNYYKSKSIQESLFYYYLKKRKTKKYIKDEKTKDKRLKGIEKEENKWMKESIRGRFKRYNRNVGRSKDLDERREKERKKKNKMDLRQALKKKKDNVYMGLEGLRGLTWLRPFFLKTWLKLDSLIFYGEYIVTPNIIEVSHCAVNCLPDNTRKRESIIKEFHKWREEKLSTKEQILNDEEIGQLKNFVFDIERTFIKNSNNLMNGLDKWIDLLDLIPNNKLTTFQGITNICLNILLIKRFLIRITWALSNYNLIAWPKDQRARQPYFFISESKEIIPYRSSVLADFNLFITTPFILYVEGHTEWVLLNEYVDKKFGFRFNVENMVGIDKLPYFKQLCDAVKGRIFYFFIDFHDLDEFLSKKDKYGEKCSFFFPDFITENFTVEEFFRAFKLWIATIKLYFEEKQKEELYKKLENEKKCSDEIIQEYESKNQVQRRTTNGFEKVLINYLKQYFPEELYELYSQRIKLDHNNRIVNHEDFESLIKTELTSRLKKLIIYSIKKDPERRGQKFPFENKLEPFYTEINNYIYRNINIQFEINQNV